MFVILEYLIKYRIHVTKLIKERSTKFNTEFIILMEKDNIILKIHVLLKKFFVVTKLLESKQFYIGECFAWLLRFKQNIQNYLKESKKDLLAIEFICA